MLSLEESGCVGGQTGWLPLPALLRKEQEVVGAAPAFLKLHSKGEYIFDYGWADAYPRLMGPDKGYYPKLQVAVPFTPVPGPRLLVDESRGEPDACRKALKSALLQMVDQLSISSAHITFCEPSEIADSPGYLPRLGEQYHWFNDDYQSFEDFLARLTSRKRKGIKRERRAVAELGLTIHTLHGDGISHEQWEAFYRMYLNTSMRKWGQPYLNLDFFRLLGQRLGPRVVLFLVEREGRWIAGAWNLKGKKALFGRNWGCLEHHEFLHFEVCYYRAIEYAIEHGMARVEAGAQGTHKIPRGYQPVLIHSLHHLADPLFRRVIADHLEQEKEHILERHTRLQELLPYRSSASSEGIPRHGGNQSGL